MAKPMQYVLEGGDLERGVRVITYGKCERSPYVENGLWFVHVPRITDASTTFFVTQEYARPSIMDAFNTDLDKWSSVAHKTISGSEWNAEYECLWGEMPFYVHVLPDGTSVRYGLSRWQSPEYPDRELWYIVLDIGDEPVAGWYKHEMFVVDKKCTSPSFMDRIGNDPKQWMRICWAHPVGIEPWNAKPEQVPRI